MCTLKNFPYKIEHTIQWSRDLFEGLFTQSIDTLHKYQENRDYLSTLTDINMLNESIRQLYEQLIETPCVTVQDCIHWAMKQFHKLFYTEIRNITHQFPVGLMNDDYEQRDSIDNNGNKFWSGNKLFPSPAELDLTVGRII